MKLFVKMTYKMVNVGGQYCDEWEDEIRYNCEDQVGFSCLLALLSDIMVEFF